MALVKSFGLLILLGLLALPTVHFTHSVYLPQRTVLQEQTDGIESLQRELQVLKSQEDTEHAALEQRLEAIEALLGVLKSAQPKDVKEAADAAANKAVATVANKTKIKAAKRSKALWREDQKCGPTGVLPNGGPAQCNPKSDAPCCSPSGWCGGTVEHCSCPSCIDYRTAAKPPEPYNLESPKRIALVVPFRDRGTHLEKFRERIQSHIASWERKGIHHSWKVYVVEQFDEQLFNRGYLFNVGFQYATVDEKNSGQKFDCVVMHDIDILPTPVVDYGWCLYPNQLSGEIECWGWGVPYPDNVGGVVSLSPTHWRGINGFSNEYDGWGGEDDDLYLRLKANNLLKGGCHTWCKDKNKPIVPMVRRPPLGEGKMTCLHDGVIVLLAMSPAAVPVSRSWLRCAGSVVTLVAGRPAMAQGVNAAIRSLSRPRPRPETGVQLSSDLGIMEGDADASGARLVAAEVLASTKVTVSFTSPWPVERASAGKSLEVRSKGASVFLQVILSGESLTSEGLLDEVLSSKGKFGAYGLPDAIKVLSDEAENGRRRLMIEFTSYSPRGVAFENRALLQAIPVKGDLFVLVGSAFDDKWPQASDQIRRTLSSFRVDAADQ